MNETPLKRRAFRAGGWTLVGHFLSLILRLGSSIVLTRIFAPETFGLLAIIAAVNVVIGLLTDIGLRQAIVQSPNGGDQPFLDTAWTLQVIRGLFIWLVSVSFAAALYLAGLWHLLPPDAVYSDSRLPGLIVVASFSALILGFQSMKLITATRDLDLRRTTMIDLVSQLLSFVFIAVLGWLTRSIWSYLAGLLLTSCTIVVLSQYWLKGPRNRFAWNRDALHEIKHFGKWIFFSSAIGAMILNGDRILLAGWIDATNLGYYSLANNLTSVADALSAKLFGSVAMPALSEVRRSQPHRLSQLFSRMRWVSDSALLFAAGFLFAAGPAIVGLLYDPRYSSAGWMLQILSFSLVFARYNLASNAYVALGRPDYMTLISVVRSISLFVFVPTFFYLFGLPGAIIGIALHMIPSTLFFLYFNWRLGLSNFKLEAIVLLVWPIGWMAGIGFDKLAEIARHYFLLHHA